jgi:hypothetical protein
MSEISSVSSLEATWLLEEGLREWALEDSYFLRDLNDGFTITVPLTPSAFNWWGKETNWHLGLGSPKSGQMFEWFHKIAPVIVMTCPEGGKFYFWSNKNTGDIFLKDAKNWDVSKETIQQNWHRFEALFRVILPEAGSALKYVPLPLRTEEFCRMAVENDGLALLFVPQKWRTGEVYESAVRQNGLALCYVPENDRTKDLCLISVSEDGRALQYVPQIHRTKTLCERSVRQNGAALQWVPLELRTPMLCGIAVRSNGAALKHVPEEHLTMEMCSMAVRSNGFALAFVPTALKTLRLCAEAIRSNEEVRRYVPLEFLGRLTDVASRNRKKPSNWPEDALFKLAGRLTGQHALAPPAEAIENAPQHR